MFEDLMPMLSRYMFNKLCEVAFGTRPTIKNAPKNWEIVAPPSAWDTWYRLHKKEK